jgi:hypothetical protein
VLQAAGWDAWSGTDSDDEVPLGDGAVVTLAGRARRSVTCLAGAPFCPWLYSTSMIFFCFFFFGRVYYVPPGWR